MTSRIHDIISSGESETLEFKERFNVDVIETAVAFANTRGGQILIGVSNNGKPAGQHFGKEALRDYVNRIVTATEPVVIPAAESHSTAEGEIIALQISEVPLKPVATRGRCYRRAGSTTRVMSAAEIAAMHLRSTGQSMDAVIVARKAKDDLDLDSVRRYMRRATLQGRRNFAEQDDPWQVLQKLELVKSETEITRAAILLFGKNPQSPLTQAVVHAGRLRQIVHIMDNRIIDGPIIDQVDETVEFIKKNLHVRFEITGAPVRNEIWDYPLVALREAVTNAICHRDYGNVADIQIKIFEDSLQIWSPGFLPFDVTVEDLLSPTHASSPRNKLIAQVFFDIGLIERYGGGIHRILDDCRAAGLPAPLFENSQGGFRIIFKAGDADKTGALRFSTEKSGALSGALKQQIIQLINDIPGIQRKTIVERTGVPERTVDRFIAECIAENKIERRGSKKTGGYWPLA
jgi:ATP-dependent DNA helicase RecG